MQKPICINFSPTHNCYEHPMNHVKAIRKDDEFLSDLSGMLTDQDNFYLWWLGQSGFLLQWRGQRLLMDPYLSDSPARISERVVEPAKLTGINLVTSSNLDESHLDPETIIPLLASNPEMQLVIPEANRLSVTDKIRKNLYFPIGLSDGKSVTVGHFTIQGISAANPEPDKDGNGNDLYLGYVISFGNWNIYHSGNSILYDGLIEKIQPFQVDLALLPINGQESVFLAKSIQAKWLIPCHYDMFTSGNEDVNAFARMAIEEAQPYCILDMGGKISSHELKPVSLQ